MFREKSNGFLRGAGEDQPAKRKITQVSLWNAALDRMTLNIIGTDAIEYVGLTIYGEGEAMATADPGFPNVPALRITLAICPNAGLVPVFASMASMIRSRSATSPGLNGTLQRCVAPSSERRPPVEREGQLPVRLEL